jgi:tetratricopeptide (TPR) repeat protein
MQRFKLWSLTFLVASLACLHLTGCSAPPSEKYQQLQKAKQQKQAQAQKQDAPPIDRGQYFADNPKGSDSDFYFKSGEAYLQRGQAQKAAEEFKKTVEVNPYHRQALLYLARAAAAQASDTQLLALFHHVRKVDPNNAEIFNVVAEHYLRRGQLDQAENKLLSALKRDPNSVAARTNLATVQQRRGDYSEAIQELEKAREKQPNNAIALAQLAKCYWMTGKRDQARTLLDRCLQLRPKSLELHLNIANHYRRNGDPTRALALYEKAQSLARDPKVKQKILLVTADTHLTQSNADAALTVLNRVKQESNGRVSPTARQLYSVAYLKKGDAARAEAELKEGMKAFPQDLSLRLKLGQTYLAEKKYSDAEAQFQDILKLNETSPEALHHLGLVYQLTEKHDQAADAYERALRVQPDSFTVLNNLAYLYAEQGTRLDESLKLAQRAEQRAPNNPEVLDTLGFVHYQRKEYDPALKYLKRAKDLSKGQPPALWLYHCALVYEAKGMKAEARAELTEAQKRNPSPKEAEQIRELREKISPD